MLLFLNRLALRLSSLRLVSLVIAAAGLIATIMSLLLPAYSSWLLPALIALLWSLLSFSFLTLFRQVPQAGQGATGWVARFKLKLSLLAFSLLGGLFLLLTLALVGLSLRGLIIFFTN